MAQTYFVSHLLDELVAPSFEMPITAITQHPYLEHYSPLAIYNQDGSNIYLNVKKINIRPLIGQSTALPTRFDLKRITAMSGGTTVTPVTMDTSNNPLDESIFFATGATVTESSTLLRNMNQQILNFTAAGRQLGARVVGQRQMNNALLMDYGRANTSTQGLTLRQNEGITLVSAAVPLTKAFQVYCLFHNVNAGSGYDTTWVIEETVRPESTDNILSILNYSSAGANDLIVIHQLEWQEIGDDNVPYFSIEKIDGLSGGTDVSSIKADTANDTLTNIQIKQNCLVQLAGHKSGAVVVNPAFIKTTVPVYGKGASFSGLALNNADKFSVVKTCYNTSQDIILREGQGLALLKINASEIGKFEFYIEFTKTAVSGGGGGGGGAYAWG
jgi:hypothetical protein